MSDTPEARPGAPRPPAAASAPRPPAPSAARITPRAPTAAAKPPAPASTTPRALSEPPLAPDSWDDDDDEHLRSSAVIPAAEELKLVPPAPPTPVVPPPVPVPRAQSSADLVQKPRAPSNFDMDLPRPPARTMPLGLPSTPRAPSVVPEAPRAPSVVPAAPLEPKTLPMAPSTAPPAVAAAPPVVSPEAQAQLFDVVRAVLDATLAPLLSKQQELEARLEALQRAARTPAAPAVSSLAPVRSMSPSVDITGSLTPAPTSRGASLIMTSYGPVSVMPNPAPRPAIETALENVGSFEMPDFAGKRKFAGGIIIGLLIVGVITAIVATVLSYS